MTSPAACSDEMGLALSRYVDRELPADARAKLESHVASCPACRDLLGVFQRNEGILSNSLAGEVFGAQAVDDVMARIRREEGPTVVAPVVEEAPSPAWRSWRTWAGAAAAALVALSLGWALAPRGASPAELARLRSEVAEARASGQQTVAALEDRVREMTAELRDVMARAALQGAPDKTGLAYLNERAIVVQANFSPAKFSSFSIWRLRAGTQDWKELKAGLAAPTYRDTDVEPGVLYQYKFRALFTDRNEWIESAPVQERLPLAGGRDPSQSVRVTFVAALPDGSQGTFRVERYVNHRWISRTYPVAKGSLIGAKEVLPEGEIDFGTGYEFESVVAGQETIVGSIGTGSEPRVLASWPNRQARLRRTTAAPKDAEPAVSIWRDRDVLLPAAK